MDLTAWWTGLMERHFCTENHSNEDSPVGFHLHIAYSQLPSQVLMISDKIILFTD